MRVKPLDQAEGQERPQLQTPEAKEKIGGRANQARQASGPVQIGVQVHVAEYGLQLLVHDAAGLTFRETDHHRRLPRLPDGAGGHVVQRSREAHAQHGAAQVLRGVGSVKPPAHLLQARRILLARVNRDQGEELAADPQED